MLHHKDSQSLEEYMLLTMTAYVIIPIYTLLVVSYADWFLLNLPAVGNWSVRQLAFPGLGLVIGLYYYIVLKRLLSYLPRHKKETQLFRCALLFLFLTVTTPFLPEMIPFQAFLPIIFAVIASALLVICLFLIIWRLSALSGDTRWMLRPYRQLLPLIVCVSVLLFLLSSIVSHIAEAFFVIAVTILVQRLYRQFTSSFSHSRYYRSLSQQVHEQFY